MTLGQLNHLPDKAQQRQLGLFSELGLSSLTSVNHCRTPDGLPGECGEISRCLYLLFDVVRLRRSVCFRNLFMVGICCPGFSSTTTVVPETNTTVQLEVTTEATTVTTEVESTTVKVTERPRLTIAPFKRFHHKSTKRPLTTTTTEEPTTLGPPSTTAKTIEIFTTTAKPTEAPYILATEASSQNITYASALRCGTSGRDGRIVGGYEANPGQWPWMV
ncbi:hypothetical protein X975_17945, partial [Stegodyphus mimosarum]